MTDTRRAAEPQPPRGRFQFSLASMLLVTFLVAVAAGALGGMLRAASGQIDVPAAVFVAVAAAAPVAVLVGLSAARAVATWFQRRRR